MVVHAGVGLQGGRSGRLLAAMATAAVLWGCAAPPRQAYVSGDQHMARAANVPVGLNAAGEACHQDGHVGDSEASIYCGSWEQPSAHVEVSHQPAATSLDAVVSGSSWREGIYRRMDCGQPEPATVLGGSPAVLLACTSRLGGWPQMAVAARANGRIWLADGVRPALPAIERSIGILSGEMSPQTAAAQPASSGLTARRLAAQAFNSGDIGQYHNLMFAATEANLAGNYASAEELYRSVAALQERILGADNPALSSTLSAQALQMSNQGQFAAADQMFARAEPLATATGQADRLASPRLSHYRGLHLLNERQLPQALAMLRQAERQYMAQLPPGALQPKATRPAAGSAAVGADSEDLLSDTAQAEALLGVIETRRTQAVALRQMGQFEQSDTVARSAVDLADARGFTQPRMTARLYRTTAFIDQSRGEKGQAMTTLGDSVDAFSRALPGSRALAETGLLWAAQLRNAGRSSEALASCRNAARALRQSQSGIRGDLLQPCLLTLAGEADAHPEQAQPLRSEMFETAQLAQSSITSEQIAQASARLIENGRDPRVAGLIRARDDLNSKLAELYGQRDDARAGGHASGPEAALLARQIASVRSRQAETERSLQAASPNYNQLVQRAVSSRDIFAALRPGEAFAAVVLFHDAGWTFLLRDGQVRAAPVAAGAQAVAGLVRRVRASLDAETEPPPPFDVEADRTLYDTVLGPVAEGLRGATALSVAPSGPLLSLPFGILLTGPARQQELAAAPWLIRTMTVEHVPAPANFVSLRKLAGTSRATTPWFGFGDFRPVTLAQAQHSYPQATCGKSARLLAGLPRLPGAQVELEAVRRLTGAGAEDELLGADFTTQAVQKAQLKQVRVLHFATHALLPTDLSCQAEPALVTSAPDGAADAAGALLTASDVAAMSLDADTVILSACNTGGPDGATSGESLTGLARSFFYAGARALLVTHWSVNDRTTAYLVALTLHNTQGGSSPGLAAALAAAQRRMLADAQGPLAIQAHPFYWGALAVIGDGVGLAGSADLARL